MPENAVAFVSEKRGGRNLDIWLIQPDGSDLRLLPTWTCIPDSDHRVETQPAWSPDGSKLAFISESMQSDGNALVCVLDFNSGNTIAFLKDDWITGFAWAPNSNQIIYGSPQGLWLASLDTSDAPSLFHEMVGGSLSWAPDGSKIALSDGSYHSNEIPGLQIMKLDGTLLEPQDENLPLGQGIGIIEDIAWAPDGKHLTSSYLSSRWGGHLALFEMGEQSFSLKQAIYDFSIYYQGESYCQSRWSPDGTQIVYVQGTLFDVGCTGAIYLTNANLSDTTVLLDGFFTYPSWSPDGQQLVFASHRAIKAQDGKIKPVGSSESIWIVNSDGTALRQLIGGDGYYYGEPVWQPLLQEP